MHAEFDALTGSKISALDIGAPAVRMSYSPTSGHTVIAILQVGPAWTFHHRIFLLYVKS
jgi:hypothetical protein